MGSSYDVYGVGHALVDAQYGVGVEEIDALGMDKGVMTLIDESRLDAIASAVSSTPVHTASGGSAANTMIAVARCGGCARYACQVGTDDWGTYYRDDLERAGVSTSAISHHPGATGQCLVFVTPDADRTMNTFLGVSSSLGPEQVEADVVQRSSYVYLEGYLLSADSGFQACRQAQTMARAGGTHIALTLSDPTIVELFGERFSDLIASGVDLLFCNEDEARALTGSADRDGAATAIADMVPAACVTCGADGAIVAERGTRARVPGFAVDAVDTTGAGDAFAGGVLYGVTHGLSLAEAASLGGYAAAHVVGSYGSRLSVSLADQIEAIISGTPPPITGSV